MGGMLPAHQGFNAFDEARSQLGLRLVVQSQLIGGNGLAQISEEGEAVGAVLVMTGIVEGVPSCPRLAVYMATSARRSRVKGSLPCAGNSAAPMLAST